VLITNLFKRLEVLERGAAAMGSNVENTT